MCDWTRCFVLTDPRSWSESDVMKWMDWHGNQFQASYGVSEAFRMTGEQLCRLSSDNFKRRSPEAGANLYAQLDVWKNGTYHFIKSRLKKQIRVRIKHIYYQFFSRNYHISWSHHFASIFQLTFFLLSACSLPNPQIKPVMPEYFFPAPAPSDSYIPVASSPSPSTTSDESSQCSSPVSLPSDEETVTTPTCKCKKNMCKDISGFRDRETKQIWPDFISYVLCFRSQQCQQWKADDSSLGIPERASSPTGQLQWLHQMGQSLRWHFQNRRLFKSCQIVGEKKKPSGHELWQAE